MLVSVVTPTYNRASFLPETIESVAAQGYRNFEHIIVDDGSTDETAGVIAKYSHLTVIRQSNAGESAAVNAGLSRACGDIIVIVNSDDPLRPDALSSAIETFTKNPAALLAYPDWEEIDEGGRILRVIQQRPYLSFETLLRSFNVSIGPATFFRRSAIERVGMRRLDRRFTGDIDLWMRIAAAGPLAHIPKVLGTHRVHSTAAMTTSRGWRMSWELARLAKDSLAMPHGVPGIAKDRREIMSYAHSVALLYCGESKLAARYHTLMQRFYSSEAAFCAWIASVVQLRSAALHRILPSFLRWHPTLRRVVHQWRRRTVGRGGKQYPDS